MTTYPDSTPMEGAIFARRWKTLGVLALCLVIIGLDNTILNVALPTLQHHFHASGSTLQWMVDSYLLAFAGFLLTAGTLGDRFGRKRALLTGLVVFAGASMAVVAVSTSGQLIALRAVMGIGGALIMPATLSIITNVFPREERAKAIGIWAAMAAIGVGLGPLFGGLLLNWFSWNSVFFVNVPVAVIAILLAIRLVPESRDPKPGSFDFIGATLSGLGVLALVYAIIEAPGNGWTDTSTLGVFGLAIALLIGFAAWELRTADPMLNLDFFRNPRFSFGVIAISVAFFSLFGAIFGVSQYLQLAHGYSALQAGAGMLPLALGLMVGAGSSTKLAPKFGTNNIVFAGLMLLSGVLLTALAWSPDMEYWPLGLWFFFGSVGMGWTMAPATDSVMGAVPEAKAGVASAMNDVARQVAGALGTAVIGSLVATLYTSRMVDASFVASPETRARAEDSIGAAHGVAAALPSGQAAHLVTTSSQAYTDALGIGLAAAAAVALAAAFAVRRKLPARHLTTAATVTAAAAESRA